jgi:3-phenylpropionate/trans-cinnamate dioxygenase ferredoxin reductase subunit
MPVKRRGHVASIRSLSADISEVVVWLKSPLDYRPGQYVRVAFAGFSAREYSPAVTAGTQPDGAELVFHLRRYENGAVSAALGRGIRNGHKVVVKGPFGNAFYRSGPSRLVLVSSGTGWAPIWSLAGAARRTDPEREIVVVASAREARNLYMLDELRLLAAEGPTSTLACCSSGTAPSGVLAGRATQFLPRLSPNDVVYVAGAPGMVEAVRALAAEAGAECYADPFLLSTNKAPLWTRLSQATRNVFRRAATPVPTCKISEPVASVAE